MSEQTPRSPGSDLESMRRRLEELVAANRRLEEQLEAHGRSAFGKLARSGELFGTLLSSVKDGVWAASADGTRMLYLNPAIERIYRRDASEFRDNPTLWIEVVHPDDRDRASRGADRLFESGAAASEYRIVLPDGEIRWILDNKTVITNDAGEPVGIGGFATDITERKQAEHALRESESRLRMALEALNGGVWDWNIATGEVYYTSSWARMLGYEPHEIEQHVRTWEAALHPDDKPEVTRRLQEHLEGRASYYSEHRMRTKAGDWIWVLDRGHVIERDENGKPLRMTGTDVNITDRKRAEEERMSLETAVQQAQKLESLGLLAGGIAHDFNNMLTGILGNAEMVSLALAPSAPARRHVEQIQQSAARAADLCRQLLAYSGRGRFVVKALDLSELVREMTRMLEVSVSKKVELSVDFATGLPAIEADVNQLRQIVMNLITNASEAIGDRSGKISIKTGVAEARRDSSITRFGDAPDDGLVYLEVSDTGCGMDERTRSRIFDPFFTTKFAGRGLGLAAVLGIVRAHRGAIELSSRPDEGTEFRILFPPTQRAREAISAPEEVPGDWRGAGTILVVDDEEAVRMLARSILDSRGFTVLCAGDGHEAVEIFRRHSRDIAAVLLDVTMPRMGGPECLAELRRCDPGVKVLLSSGYHEDEVLKGLEVGGKVGFIHKPYRQADFVARLRAVLQA